MLVAILCLGFMAACTSTHEDINGYYQYEKTVYRNSLGEYIMTKEDAPDYIISKTSFTFLYIDGTRKQISSSFKKSKVDTEEFAALFQYNINVPDISVFKQRYQYIINDEYSLYAMDSEVWLALCADNTMWSIYQLVKFAEE